MIGPGTWVISFAVLAGATPEEPARALQALRTSEAISVDGRLDEPVWQTAPLFSDFVVSFPSPGTKPELRTEARVLYDDSFLYVGVTCFDPQPELIVRNLGRRDSAAPADWVEVAIDSSADRRTAYDFMVNAAGVQRDRLLFGDLSSTDTWDAVWEAAAAMQPDGWSVELAIPLRVLRFSPGATAWGIDVRRMVPRTHQFIDSSLMPRDANPVAPGDLVVSRFGRLEGLKDLRPGRDVELTPYSAARAALRPRYSDPARPTPRLLDPSIDVGLDFKMALTSDLSLAGAINPDFGQVEADQVIQNLSTQEPFFPEKRPFFLQGLDLFQPVGAEYGSQQQVFYSRRIGLSAPILAAVKLTGTATNRLDIGVLDVTVLGAGNPSTVPVGYLSPGYDDLEPYERAPDRRWQLHPTQPLHFGPNDALPVAHPQPTNYLAAVARQRFGENSSVGAIFAAATPLGPRCERREFSTDEDYARASCTSQGGNTLAADWNLRSASGDWGFLGQVEGTQQVGGDPEGRVLADGTVMHPGELGYGGHLRIGKLGGEPFRFDATYIYLSPTLDMNPMGFQPFSNYQWADANLHYVRPSGLGPLHSFSLDYNLDVNWSTDGRAIPRGLNTNLRAMMQLPSFDTLGATVGAEDPQYDLREIEQSGVAFRRPSSIFFGVFGSTDASRRLVLSGEAFMGYLSPLAGQRSAWGQQVTVNIAWRPADALETRLDSSFAHRPTGARWLATGDDGTALFGFQDPSFLSVTLRQQLVVTPKLSLQLYAQLFSAGIRYGPFWSANLGGLSKLEAAQLAPYGEPVDANGHAAVLNVNAVARWEYHLGSVIYLVYTRSQRELPTPSTESASTSLWPQRLFAGPTTDTVMLKLSYCWAS